MASTQQTHPTRTLQRVNDATELAGFLAFGAMCDMMRGRKDPRMYEGDEVGGFGELCFPGPACKPLGFCIGFRGVVRVGLDLGGGALCHSFRRIREGR